MANIMIRMIGWNFNSSLSSTEIVWSLSEFCMPFSFFFLITNCLPWVLPADCNTCHSYCYLTAVRSTDKVNGTQSRGVPSKPHWKYPVSKTIKYK